MIKKTVKKTTHSLKKNNILCQRRSLVRFNKIIVLRADGSFGPLAWQTVWNASLFLIPLFVCLLQFVCQFCYKIFSKTSKQAFIFHLQAQHGVGGNSHSCPTCSKTGFQSRDTFFKHKRACAKKSGWCEHRFMTTFMTTKVSLVHLYC